MAHDSQLLAKSAFEQSSLLAETGPAPSEKQQAQSPVGGKCLIFGRQVRRPGWRKFLDLRGMVLSVGDPLVDVHKQWELKSTNQAAGVFNSL